MRTILSFLQIVVVMSVSSNAYAHKSHSVSHTANTAKPPLVVLKEELERFRLSGSSDSLAKARAIASELTPAQLTKPKALYLAARTAQAAHDFSRAKVLLERLLSFAPRDPIGSALLSSIYSVEGKTKEALQLCDAVMGLQGIGCKLRARLSGNTRPDPAGVERFRNLLVVLEDRETADSAAWLWATLGDASVAGGNLSEAAGYYRVAIRRKPIVRYQAALADVLNATGQPHAVLDLLDKDVEALSLRVKRMVALEKLDQLDRSSEFYKSLADEIEHLRRHNDFDHAREIAEFLLDVEHQPEHAVKIAKAGLAQQKEREDVALVLRASLMAESLPLTEG